MIHVGWELLVLALVHHGLTHRMHWHPVGLWRVWGSHLSCLLHSHLFIRKLGLVFYRWVRVWRRTFRLWSRGLSLFCWPKDKQRGTKLIRLMLHYVYDIKGFGGRRGRFIFVFFLRFARRVRGRWLFGGCRRIQRRLNRIIGSRWWGTYIRSIFPFSR